MQAPLRCSFVLLALCIWPVGLFGKPATSQPSQHKDETAPKHRDKPHTTSSQKTTPSTSGPPKRAKPRSQVTSRPTSHPTSRPARSASRPTTAPGRIVTCAKRLQDMPQSWRPPNTRKEGQAPWSKAEQKAVSRAVWAGLQEMSQYFKRHPAQIKKLWDNAVEAFLDTSYGAAHIPKVYNFSRNKAREILAKLAPPYAKKTKVTCWDFGDMLTLANYAHILWPSKSHPHRIALKRKLIALTNRSFRDCKTLKAVFDVDYKKAFATGKISNGNLYHLVMWSISLIEGLAVPGIRFSPEVKRFLPALWKFLPRYKLKNASAYKQGASNSTFYDDAYLVTHIAYIPSGYGRYKIYVKDAPWLYRFLRENFYAVMKMGELDLLAEFVDLYRQLGCTEHNDYQLRDGTRFLMQLYRKAGSRWMNHRESYETKASTPYDLIHKAWTGIGGLRPRKSSPERPGTYGGIVKEAFRQLGLR